jgi:hypothetical protein
MRRDDYCTGHWSDDFAEKFTESKNGAVRVEFVRVPSSEIDGDVINEATSQIGLYDGFLTGPLVAGSVVQYNGWADLTSYVQESAGNAADWAEIFLGYRKWIAQYEGKIIMYPLDGDLLHMYYRKDILETYGLTVPRTWEEYNAVANATHGIVFENRKMVGSCVGRLKSCAGAYWANQILATMTQTEGPWSGHLFDTANMKPLSGAALERTLMLLEEQVKFGPPDRKCVDFLY